jgi:hypothetical protein
MAAASRALQPELRPIDLHAGPGSGPGRGGLAIVNRGPGSVLDISIDPIVLGEDRRAEFEGLTMLPESLDDVVQMKMVTQTRSDAPVDLVQAMRAANRDSVPAIIRYRDEHNTRYYTWADLKMPPGGSEGGVRVQVRRSGPVTELGTGVVVDPRALAGEMAARRAWNGVERRRAGGAMRGRSVSESQQPRQSER